MKYFVIYLLPVILVLFMGSSILSANSAFGLSCDATNMTWSFEETDVIFLGKALSKEYQPNPIHEDRTDAVTLFSIKEQFKGVYQDTIKVSSDEMLWGFNFTQGQDYVVFANNNDGNLEHALCTPTQLASESNISEIRKISQNYILPPLVQSEFGVNLKEIQCKQNLVLIQKYDDSPACVTESTKLKLIERGWTKDDSVLSKINARCMTIEQSKQTAPFFKTPTYLPEGYSHVCSQSGTPFESYIVYYYQESPNQFRYLPVIDGAIFIYQYDSRRIGLDKELPYDSPEQHIQEIYDGVMKNNPSLNPQLITINGMLAYAVDSCPDCGMQIANFSDGTVIQKSTSTETKIEFMDENGVKYMLVTTLPLSELIKVAESLQ